MSILPQCDERGGLGLTVRVAVNLVLESGFPQCGTRWAEAIVSCKDSLAEALS